MKWWYLLPTFSHQNSLFHYVYCSLCPSFFLKEVLIEMFWKSLWFNLLTFSLIIILCFYKGNSQLFLRREKYHSLFFCVILFGKSWKAVFVFLFFSKFYYSQEESHIFKGVKNRGAWLQSFVFQIRMEKSIMETEYFHLFVYSTYLLRTVDWPFGRFIEAAYLLEERNIVR